jgi:hypothetical protein
MRAGPVWDKVLVKHVHESLKHPPELQPTAFCCFIAPTAKHHSQEAGLETIYDGSISSNEIPKHGDTRADVHLKKANQNMKPKGTLSGGLTSFLCRILASRTL